MSKYTPETLLPALHLFVAARNKALEGGFTENGGAIHSVERIVDILSQRLCYPDLTHISDLKSDPNAEISVEAQRARESGDRILIEHVMPQRAFAREIIRIVSDGGNDADVTNFIRSNYRLVLLSEAETKLIDLPSMKCARLIFAIVSTTNIP